MYLILDMDGVILDSSELKLKSIELTFKKFNKHITLDCENSYRMLQEHPHDIFKEYFTECEPVIAWHERMHSSLRKNEISHHISYNDLTILKDLFEGIALFTAQPRHRVDEMLNNSMINLFDIIITEDDVKPFVKPSPFGIDLIFTKNDQWDRKTTYFVGDTFEDIQCGKDAMIHTIAATWGFTQKQTLLKSKADLIIDKPMELISLANSKSELQYLN